MGTVVNVIAAIVLCLCGVVIICLLALAVTELWYKLLDKIITGKNITEAVIFVLRHRKVVDGAMKFDLEQLKKDAGALNDLINSHQED